MKNFLQNRTQRIQSSKYNYLAFEILKAHSALQKITASIKHAISPGYHIFCCIFQPAQMVLISDVADIIYR